MRFRKERDRLSRSNHRPKHDQDGPRKSKRHSKLANTTHTDGSTTISGIYGLLPVLCPELLKNRPTAPRPHKKNDPLALGPIPRTSVPRTQGANVLQSRPYPTRFRQEILPTNRRLRIWRGRRTLARGRTHALTGKMSKTNTPPNSILLRHIHAY